MKKRIFASGGSGFIGKNIIESLGHKYNFFAPSHKQLNLLNPDLVHSYFSKYGPFDAVLHTAIVGGNRKTGDTVEDAFDSLRMFFNLASNKNQFKKFFYFGSGIEYGKEKPVKRFSEDDFAKRVPQSNWGLYKYICAKFVESHKNFVNLRLFGVFGKYEDYRIRFVSNSICKNILGIPITINQNIVMDYLYIEDLVTILDRFLNKPLKYNTYNITTGKGIDLITIVEKINKISKSKVAVSVVHKGFNNEYTGSNRRLLSEFSDIEFTDIDVAISQLYEWYQKRKNEVSKKGLLREYF